MKAQNHSIGLFRQAAIAPRIAFNKRAGFLLNIDSGFHGETINADNFGQRAIADSDDINDNFTSCDAIGVRAGV